MNAESVAIVGAGVSGLTCGVLLAERGYCATILADQTGAQTTSGAAAAIWYPYDAAPAHAVMTWALETYDVLAQLGEVSTSGVSMLELRTYAREGEIEVPDWAIKLGARRLTGREEPGLTNHFASGFALTVPLADTTIYLEYLTRRFQAADGAMREGVHFENLEEVPAEFGSIIHCAGLGARDLVGDKDLEPHRGQVAIIPKIDLTHALVCDDPPLMYAIPRANDCVLGGTNELSDNRAVDAGDTSRIVAECSRILQIKPPRLLAGRVGLRPFRKSGVRVASDRCRDGRVVIHNYGHGGSGFTLSWGCAQTVAQLLSHETRAAAAVEA